MILLALLLTAAPLGQVPPAREAMNVTLGAELDKVRGQMLAEGIKFRRAEPGERVLFYERCARPFEDATPCALVAERGRLLGMRGSVGPLPPAVAKQRFLRALKHFEAERGGPGQRGAPRGSILDRYEWRTPVDEGEVVVAAVWLVKLQKGHEVRFAYVLEKASR